MIQDIDNLFCEDFMGPSCLYKALFHRDRISKTPLYLRRNLRRRYVSLQAKDSSHILGGDVSFQVNKELSKSIHFFSAHMLVRHNETFKFIGRPAEIELVGEVEKVENVLLPFSFNWKSKFIEDSSCAFILLIASSARDSQKLVNQAIDFFSKNEAALKNQFDPNSSGNQIMVHLNSSTTNINCFSFVDVTSVLSAKRKQLGMKFVPPISAYRLYMDNIGSNFSVKGIMREKKGARFYGSEKIYDSGISCPYELNVSKPVRLQKTSNLRVHVSHERLTPSADEESSEKYENGMLTFHYQVRNRITADNPHMSVAKTFAWHESQAFLMCPWCGPGYMKHPSPVRIDTTTKRPVEDTLEALCALAQHLSCNHYHFKYDFGLDKKGHLHILVERNRSVDQFQDETIIGKKRNLEEVHLYRSFEMPQIALKYLDEVTMTSIRADKFEISKLENRMKVSNAASLKSSTKGEMGTEKKNKSNRVEDPRMEGRSFYGRPNRIGYFHATNGQPLTVEEIGCDSENELDGSWELNMRNRGIDEYSDITMQEKEFMKLWNTHITNCPPYGDRLLPVVCELFLQRHVDTLVKENLRHNFSLHLINLWDFGLLLSEEVMTYLQYVDVYASQIHVPQC